MSSTFSNKITILDLDSVHVQAEGFSSQALLSILHSVLSVMSIEQSRAADSQIEIFRVCSGGNYYQ